MLEMRLTRSSALLVFLLTLFVITPFGESIICFQCKSWEDPGCEDVKVNDTSSRFAKFCDDEEIPVGERIFCRTISQTIRDGNGTKRLWRKCGWKEYKTANNVSKPCYYFSDGHHDEAVCQCFTDYCNAASSRGLAAPVLVLPFLGLLRLRSL